MLGLDTRLTNHESSKHALRVRLYEPLQSITHDKICLEVVQCTGGREKSTHLYTLLPVTRFHCAINSSVSPFSILYFFLQHFKKLNVCEDINRLKPLHLQYMASSGLNDKKIGQEQYLLKSLDGTQNNYIYVPYEGFIRALYKFTLQPFPGISKALA